VAKRVFTRDWSLISSVLYPQLGNFGEIMTLSI